LLVRSVETSDALVLEDSWALSIGSLTEGVVEEFDEGRFAACATGWNRVVVEAHGSKNQTQDGGTQSEGNATELVDSAKFLEHLFLEGLSLGRVEGSNGLNSVLRDEDGSGSGLGNDDDKFASSFLTRDGDEVFLEDLLEVLPELAIWHSSGASFTLVGEDLATFLGTAKLSGSIL
jgi:hypothetical protein